MVTERISQIISERGVSIAKIADTTGISSQILYHCFNEKHKRELKADELIMVCKFLNVNPLEIATE